MANWGIMGGSAVDTYAKHKKDARDAAWEDQQRAEWARIRDEQMKLDAAVNGAPEAVAPPAMPPGGLQVDKMGQGIAAPAPTGVAPQAAAAPKKRRSEVMLEQAERVRASGTGIKGMELAMKLEQNAADIMTRERDEELTGILRSQEPAAQKIEKLMGMVGDSPFVPGSVQMVQGKDGLYLQHMMPGRDKPFQQKVEGDPLQWMAMRVRALTDPNIYFKQKEAQRLQGGLDNDIQRTDDTREHNRAMEGIARNKTAAGIEIATLKRDMTRNNYTPAGLDKDGAMVSFDKNTGDMKRADGKPVQDPDLFRKFIGGSAKAEPDLTKSQELSYKSYLKFQEENPDAPPAVLAQKARALRLPAHLMPADPLAAALPKPGTSLMGGPARAAPAVVPAAPPRGLKVGDFPPQPVRIRPNSPAVAPTALRGLNNGQGLTAQDLELLKLLK